MGIKTNQKKRNLKDFFEKKTRLNENKQTKKKTKIFVLKKI